MLSNKPYLIRAFHDWIVDSECTPILVIDANNPRVKAPLEYAEDGEIIFNISSHAVRELNMTNEKVEFRASFSGIIHIVSAPISGIIAVYAEENGEGIYFDAEEDANTTTHGLIPLKTLEGVNKSNPIPAEGSHKNNIKPFLKLVE